MSLNPYFLQGSPSEQRLVQDLINEQLSIYGQDVLYMPRKIINEKTIIKEIITSKFDDSYRIEAYISTFDGFGGNGDILSKFGVRSTDEVTFVISKEKYEDFITPKLELFSDNDIKVTKRPQEGDLIYLPLDNALFEIKYVEHKVPFYQLNNLYVYELRCELFEYEDEVIDTGIQDVDKSVKDFGYIATITMVGTGASVSNLSVNLANALNNSALTYSVSKVDITNGGSGYASIPRITFQNPPAGGVTATGVAMLDRGSISKILIINPGIGYTRSPGITIRNRGTSGSGGIATAIITQGALGPIQIDSGGVGYSTAPILTIGAPIDPFSVAPIPEENIARAEAVLNTSGIVTAVRFINAGSNYLTPPEIEVTSPAGISTGDYQFNEVISGSTTGSTAYVKNWNYDDKILKISIITGSFALGEKIIGIGASYRVLSIETDDIHTPFAENKQIEEEADQILDFSEKNPFGEY